MAQQRLAEQGIATIGDLARTPSTALEHLLGRAVGAKLTALAQDQDPRRIAGSRRARSVGAQSALGRRRPTPALVREVLAHLADRVAVRLRAKNRAGRTVTVRVRFAGMRAVTRSTTLALPVAATLTLTEIAERLAWQAIDDQGDGGIEITLLAVAVSNLTSQVTLQMELDLSRDPHDPSSAPGAARAAVDRSMDAIRKRFGRDAVGYLPARHRSTDVPDDFRTLAEHEL